MWGCLVSCAVSQTSTHSQGNVPRSAKQPLIFATYRCKWLPEVTGKEELLSVGFYSSPFPVVRLGDSITINKASAGVSIRPLAFALSLLCTRTRAKSTEPDPRGQRPVAARSCHFAPRCGSSAADFCRPALIALQAEGPRRATSFPRRSL